MKQLILVIEDNQTDRLLLKRILENMGNEVLELEDGRQIMEMLASNTIDLVLIDWILPCSTGGELIKMLRANPKCQMLPIIGITRLLEQDFLEAAFKLGANDFITKPIKIKEVECRVERVLENFKQKKQCNYLQELNRILEGQNEQLKESLNIQNALASRKEQKLNEELMQTKSELMNRVIQSTSAAEKIKLIFKNLKEVKSNIENKLGDKVYLGQINDTLKVLHRLEKEEFVWEEFTQIFDHVLDGFFDRLRQHNSKLTAMDLRICALIKLELDYQEIATILGLDPDNFKMKRYRLKKKLNLSKKQNLRSFLFNLEGFSS